MTTLVRPALLDDLESGRLRVAEPDPDAPGGWRVNSDVKASILNQLADRATVDWPVGPFAFRDRVGAPLHQLSESSLRIVPGGTSVRAGAHLGASVVVMPPSFINIGAWIGPETMIDSHVLVGSCAQIGARVHLAAHVTIGGVLEPPGARPVVIEDDAFVGAGSAVLEGVVVGARAVIGAGVTLTGTSSVYDLVRECVHHGTRGEPLVVPAGAVVVAGARALPGSFATAQGVSLATAVLIKDRDAGTDARVAIEASLR